MNKPSEKTLKLEAVVIEFLKNEAEIQRLNVLRILGTFRIFSKNLSSKDIINIYGGALTPYKGYEDLDDPYEDGTEARKSFAIEEIKAIASKEAEANKKTKTNGE